MALIDSRPTSLASFKSLTPDEVRAFKQQGITNNQQLLDHAKTRGDVTKLAKATGLTATRVKEAVNRADLVRLDGLGPAMADLFENAGVNSVKELAQRNPASLHQALSDYAKRNPALQVKEPSANQVKALVTRAALSSVATPVGSFDAAASQATSVLHGYVDGVLFSQDPEGQAFRTAVRDFRPQSEWPALQQRGHDEVATFFRDADRSETPDRYLFTGAWLGLYTEVGVRKAGGVDRLFIEID
jgi:predicted flap endonuclease-1-like 5' DNA nuclease